MSMKPGDLLQDKTSGQKRFRIVKLLRESRSFFVAQGEDTHLDNMRVVLKAIRYSDTPNDEERQQRREALQLEMEALTLSSPLLPEPIDWLEIASPEGLEPVLVQEFISGKTLRQEVARAQEGMAPARALNLIREIALALSEMHTKGWVLRDLDPDHIILGYDDIIHMVGLGNATKIGKRPLQAKIGVSPSYSAPEIRAELSGKFLTPRSDIYSLGALLSFLLTGVEPGDQVESPLEQTAFDRLKKLPEGYQLLVSKCLQPMAKHRYKSIEQLLQHLHASTLPTRQTKGFAELELPAPFTRNRAQASKISQGPLISVPRSPDKSAQPEGAAVQKRPDQSPAPWYKSCLPWASVTLMMTSAGVAALAHWWP